MRAFLLLCIQAVAGFTGRGAPALVSTQQRAASRAQHVITMGGRAATPLGRVSTKEGKLIKINLLKEALDGSTLIFNLPSVGLTPKVMSELRRKMPDDAQIIVGVRARSRHCSRAGQAKVIAKLRDTRNRS